MPAPGIMSSENPNWRTPASLWLPLLDEFRFDLDAAADARSHLTDVWLGPESPVGEVNGLAADWSAHGTRAWVNPPYSRAVRLMIEPWIQHAANQKIPVVALIPARTDTRWWHSIVMASATEIRLLEGRVNFVHPDTGLPGKSGGTFPSALVVWDRLASRSRRPPHVVSYRQDGF